ncbi:MAG: preprotein translocase subunit SecA [Clostridiales bacterium]|nr:preprotein translocase subunit SecA [Clostridiales bacterium]
MIKLIEKVIGSYSDREVRRLKGTVDKIESLEPEMEKLSDKELRGKTKEFQDRVENGESLDDLLPEAFAVVREASKRVLGLRHFRVQLIGGIVLHQGRIAEMKTGEGKTLVATLPVYLNALTKKGVHVVTVNDYLAKRDSEWMGKVYNYLGLSVGLIVHDLDNQQRKEAYDCDITYGTNNELGFDYLRDNMVIYKEDMVQRELNYAIVDEVDSILIDEARTPLIISGMGEKSTGLYALTNTFVSELRAKVYKETDDKKFDDEVKEDYIVDEKANTATLTPIGVKKAEEFFHIENLSDPENLTISHHINQAIRAYGLMKNERDYVVKDGEVLIVDEFTGRIMYGRRYSDGLHQAIEAKEGVKIERESKTLATITFQNYFRMYHKLSGMTGTAQTEESEFQTIYKLDVVCIPTNIPVARKDLDDMVYNNQRGKFNAIVNDIMESNKIGQPVLVGTVSIENSELLSDFLKKHGIKHKVLNAKYHEKEAEIIAQAGKLGAVTIATNMAGRGTDIVLGGNPEYMAKQELRKKGYSDYLIVQSTSYNETDDEEILEAREQYKKLYTKFREETNKEREEVIKAGGLKIIGTERHESRRIDNQLRGRAGRQGDVGSSRFYISFEDDLMRLFCPERVVKMIEAMGFDEDQVIEHKWLSRAIENAQKRVEGKNFSIRKNVLQFDDVMNTQREVIYKQRRQVLNGENLREYYLKLIESIVDNIVNAYCSEETHAELWDWRGIILNFEGIFLNQGEFKIDPEEQVKFTKESLKDYLVEIAIKKYEQKEEEITPELMREFERVVLLRTVDEKWMDHIDAMDQLRQGIYLRGYAQRDPVIEYKFEGFEMFEEMVKSIQEESIKIVMHSKIQKPEQIKREQVAKPVIAVHGEEEEVTRKPVVKTNKVGRNDMCPCGSGKKYKQCCGR